MSQVSPAADNAGLTTLLRSLNSRNYRLFFFGQLVSLIGTWLTQVATGWLVYRLTDSKLMLGTVSFVGQVPAFVLAPLAGVLVDRWNQHRTLMVTQTLAMVQSGLLAVLTLAHLINIPWIIGLYAFQGLVNAVDIPARQAFVLQLVDRREDLPNAIALNSTIFNAARLLGPSLAGVLIAAFGEGICFSIDAISYVGVIVALGMMVVKPHVPHKGQLHVLNDFIEGIRYAMGFRPIRSLLSNLAIVTLAGIPIMVLMPVFARDILHGGPATLGLLTGATGLGAMIGGIRLAARKTIVGLGRVIPLASAGLGLALIAFGFSHSLWLSIPLVAFAGFGMITQTASSNTLLQTIVDDDKRGRVMSLFGMCFQGTMPIGSLLSGVLANQPRIGAGGTVMIGGAGCIIAGIFFLRQLPLLRQDVRPIYIQKGILPAPGLAGAESAAMISPQPSSR